MSVGGMRKMEDSPLQSAETLRVSISKPVTRKRCSENNSARGRPTYPRPMTPTRAVRLSILVLRFSEITIEAFISQDHLFAYVLKAALTLALPQKIAHPPPLHPSTPPT